LVDRGAARRYAQAYVNVLEGTDRLEAGLAELKFLRRSYAESLEFQHFLGSPEIGTEQKQHLLSRTFSDSVGPEGMGLLTLLLQRDRIDHLPVVGEEAVSVAEARRGILRGKVFTAHPISSKETEELAKAAGKILGKQVLLERHVDPQLIGGVRVVIGSALLDRSVETVLKEIRKQLLEAKVI